MYLQGVKYWRLILAMCIQEFQILNVRQIILVLEEQLFIWRNMQKNASIFVMIPKSN